MCNTTSNKNLLIRPVSNPLKIAVCPNIQINIFFTEKSVKKVFLFLIIKSKTFLYLWV